jgi:hypothetical protein
MRPGVLAVAVLAAIAIVPSFAQLPVNPNDKRINLHGTLELVDKPPAATPVEAYAVVIHELHGGDQFVARPDRDGRFTLANVRPGRYFLVLSFPGRIQVFANGLKSLMPDDFELAAIEGGPLRIVVSLKTSVLSVDVAGIQENHKDKDIVALLSPADPYLTLRESSILNTVSARQTEFRFATPGSYTLFIIDSEFQRVVASSVAVRNALRDKATAVQVRDDGETKATANYVSPDAVKQAITEGGLRK